MVRSGGRLVGSVRGRLAGQEWEVSRLLVAPDLVDRGLDRLLLEHAQRVAPPEARVVRLVTDRSVLGDLRRYRKDGFRLAEGGDDRGGRVVLTRVISRR
ncbi:GNAT family N-acetyltransferase [Nocardioides campestrisoli]|uniref:GNAT family N-acetyltransferase n=1 Tax=Nocardioides campestrisoli TaxID=2736757 RepID=UPI00359C873B